MKNAINVFDISNYFIKSEKIKNLTNLKLQKLVFFAYCKHLIEYQEKLFDEQIEAWGYGPVIPSLYFKTKNYGKGSDLNKINNIFQENEINKLTDKQKLTLDYIVNKYCDYSPFDLVDLTHADNSPWHKTFLSYDWSLNIITDHVIKEYYLDPKNKDKL